ncbi:primary-amine oxidase [Paludisphaera borealis]|uniref:Amine oxidase n=1 Tax=Paludisphaera borealis TaxID=1387353 RepID=A0A1U7CT14_9BACT|nr:primary-amine oxidase [Paludisphaera borealis]APW62039.1 Copper methylamine oxidase [Paludisphaera borealis]
MLEPIQISRATSATRARSVHPLEPLSADEVRRTVTLLRDAGKVTPTTRFVSVALREPAKDSVHGWDGGLAPPREAFAVLFDNAANACYETSVSLADDVVLSWEHVPGVQPTMTIDEQVECEQAVLASPAFRKALKAHTGVDDTSLVMVDIWSAGNYGTEEDGNRRLARPLCFLRSDPTDNGYVRPIEGLRPIVDLNTMEVVRIEEYGRWPIPPGGSNYGASRQERFRDDIRPLEIVQPEGPSFEVEGYQVAWQKWRFVIGFNAREGLTLNHLRYDDDGRERSVLYRGSLTEMVVPYGDPGETQRRKNAFDVGEYGMGMCANSLELGCDCLGLIRYFDAHLCDSRGEPLTIKNAVCMHEEDYGILWKHTDRRLPDAPEVRRSRRLVVSSISTVENYEYGFFWYLYQDGTIQFEIKLTGILSLGAARPGESPKHGCLVAPQLYAPNHQHFFNMRLDFDLDGVANTVHRVDVVADAIDESNPFENAFHAEATPLTTEKAARGHLKLETARTWKIVNPQAKNHVGEPVGYKLLPGDNAFPLASPNAWWRKRARFVDHHVWVTPFSPDERYGAGDYPNQSRGGDGLLRWTDQDRPIEATDVVLWYTFGHTHIPRPEDYPVMPTAYIGFTLKPAGFFTANPALDVPPSAKKDPAKSCCH